MGLPPSCHSFDVGWAKVSGRGRIYSWERPWHPCTPPWPGPGRIWWSWVKLPDAGHVRMVGNLLGDPMQDVVIGREVQAVFEDPTRT